MRIFSASCKVMENYVEVPDFINIDEMNVDHLKVELKEDEQAHHSIEVPKKDIKTNNTNRCQIQGTEMVVRRQPSCNFAIVSGLYSLLEDYKAMACSSRSLLCSQPPLCHAILLCELCGEDFMGNADRLMKLCQHFESVHPAHASQLILEAMCKYDKLITHMRKSLEFDKWFGFSHYDMNARIKSLHCHCFSCNVKTNYCSL